MLHGIFERKITYWVLFFLLFLFIWFKLTIFPAFSSASYELIVEQTIVTAIYSVGVIGWLLFWGAYMHFELLKENKMLKIPFYLCLIYLTLNLLISAIFFSSGDMAFEEQLFTFLDERSAIAITATGSILIIATIIYGTTNIKFPYHFVRLNVFSCICLLGLTIPVLWIPYGFPKWLVFLRHFQTVGFLWGVFLCISGILVLLQDVMAIHQSRQEDNNS